MRYVVSYICLTVSILLILVAGTETVKTCRYDMLNQGSWIFMYLFGCFYGNKLIIRLIFVACSVLASIEFWDEIRHANDVLNPYEYILVLVAMAWVYFSYIEIKKLRNKQYVKS